MIRHLLATTALAGLLATSALAQQPTGTVAPTATSAMPAANADTYAQRLEADQYLASKLTGTDLYESDAVDARTIGEIQNFVIGNDGKVVAAVIATSGLDDDKTVAAPIDRIEWKSDDKGTQRAVLKANVAELQGAPEFVQQTPQQAADNGAALPGSGATTTANNAAPGGSTPAATTMPAAGGYLAALGGDQRLSKTLIGSNVYSGPGDDAQTIGSVNDLVLAKSGDVPTVLVGVGGFLGIGEKNVGVPFAELLVQPGSGDEPRLVMAATKEQLTAAPTFETSERSETTAANTAPAATMPTDDAMAANTAPTGQSAGDASAMNADPSPTASTSPSNDKSAMQPVAGPELTADNLSGVSVYGPNDQSIGKVGDIALTTDGRVDAVVVDVGGFLGIGSKPVAVAMDNLQFMRDTNGTLNIYTQFTKDQLKGAPEFNKDSYAQNRGTMRLGSSGVATPPAQ